MNIKMFLVCSLFVFFIAGCYLPKEDVLEESDFAEFNKIKGFDTPTKIVQSGDYIYVLDLENGIYQINVNSLSGINKISGKNFYTQGSYLLQKGKPEGDKIPYDVNTSRWYKLNPIDFTIVDYGATKFIFALAEVEGSSNHDDEFLESYYVYRVDITDPLNIPAVDNDKDFLPLDAFYISEDDEDDGKRDVGNVGTAIAGTTDALYISGDKDIPLRVILLDNGEFHSSNDFDADGDRSIIKLNNDDRKTSIPGNITAYQSGSTAYIYILSRDQDDYGIHKYTYVINKTDPFNLSNRPQYVTNIADDDFTFSLKILDDDLFASFYKKAASYDCVSSGKNNSIQVDEDSLVAASVPYKVGSEVRTANAYCYKIEKNIYATTKYTHKLMYSGIKVFKGGSKVKNLYVDEIITDMAVVEISGKYYSFSVCTGNGSIIVNDIN